MPRITDDFDLALCKRLDSRCERQVTLISSAHSSEIRNGHFLKYCQSFS